jgi:hypothetical protein
MTFLTKQAVIKIMRVRKHASTNEYPSSLTFSPEMVWMSLGSVGGWEKDEQDENISRKYMGMVITLNDYVHTKRKKVQSRGRRDIYIPERALRKKREAEDYNHFIEDFIKTYNGSFEPIIPYSGMDEYYEILWREIGTNDWMLWCIVR